jgi:acetyl-CoA carboxylase, biotin carboxylase subunit
VDEGVYEGWTVPMDYDPLLSKLVAWGNSREETISRLRRALEEYSITGIKTNSALFRRILAEPDFLRAEIHTKWLDEVLRRPHPAARDDANGADAAAIAAALWQATRNGAAPTVSNAAPESAWKREGRRQQQERLREV